MWNLRRSCHRRQRQHPLFHRRMYAHHRRLRSQRLTPDYQQVQICSEYFLFVEMVIFNYRKKIISVSIWKKLEMNERIRYETNVCFCDWFFSPKFSFSSKFYCFSLFHSRQTVLSNQNTAPLLSSGTNANGNNNQLNNCSGVRECAGCCKRITERFLLKALDLYWHEDCLKWWEKRKNYFEPKKKSTNQP